jgi:hypothetical protein
VQDRFGSGSSSGLDWEEWNEETRITDAEAIVPQVIDGEKEILSYCPGGDTGFANTVLR